MRTRRGRSPRNGRAGMSRLAPHNRKEERKEEARGTGTLEVAARGTGTRKDPGHSGTTGEDAAGARGTGAKEGSAGPAAEKQKPEERVH